MAKDIKRTELLLHMYQELGARISRVEKDLDEFLNSKNDDPLKNEISKSIPVVERSSSKNDVLNDSSQSNKLSKILDGESISSPLPPIDNKVKEYCPIEDTSDGEIGMYRGHPVSIPIVKFNDPEKQSRYDSARAAVLGLLNEGSGLPIGRIEKPPIEDSAALEKICKELSGTPSARLAVNDVRTALARFKNVVDHYVVSRPYEKSILDNRKTNDLIPIINKIWEFMNIK